MKATSKINNDKNNLKSCNITIYKLKLLTAADNAVSIYIYVLQENPQRYVKSNRLDNTSK